MTVESNLERMEQMKQEVLRTIQESTHMTFEAILTKMAKAFGKQSSAIAQT